MAAVDFHNRVEQLFIAYLGRPANSTELELYSNEYNSIVEWNAANPTQPKTFYNMNLSTYLLDNSAFKGSTNYGQVVEDMYTRLTGAAIPMDLYNVLVGRMMDGNWGVDKLAIKMLKATGLWAFEDGTYGKPPAFQFQATATQPAVTTDFTVSTAAHHASAQAKVEGAKLFTEQLDTPAENTALTTAQGAASATTWLAGVTDTAPATAESAAAGVAGATDASVGASGETYMLTTDAQQITGTAGNDTFNGSNTTLVLDVLDGAGGTDTLNYSDASKAGSEVGVNTVGATLTSIEIINARAIGEVQANTTGFSGVTDLNALAGAGANLTAATTTNVTASGLTDAITINGGKNITVTDATAGKDITIGATTVNAGTITVTDSVQGAGKILIDGGTSVTVTASNAAAAGGVITVGQGGAATDLPSGAVSVTSNHVGTAATDVAMGAITVSGGSTVTVTQTADASKAAADTTGATLTQGAVTVTAGDTTTSVTVTQAASQAEVKAVATVAGVTETASVKFSDLAKGKTVIIGGDGDGTLEAGELAFTAAKDLTAAEVAQAFANLTNPDTQGSGVVANGVYTVEATPTFFTTWTSGAANGDTVVFTSTTANTDVGDFKVNTTGTAIAAPTVTAGVAAAGTTGKLGVITGAVTIDDNATASITTVTLDGYGATGIGANATLSKLQTLSLANSGGAAAGDTDAAVAVDAAGVATLALNLNNVQGAVSLDGAADSALKTLNITATGANSTFALTAAAVETLTIAGDKSLGLAAGTFTALKSITVSGSAGATFDGDEADTLTSVNTSATTGAVTATINGTKATYTGGAGVDTVTLATGTALDKAIDLGAGDDTLIFGAAVASSTATLSGGEGTDTLSMAFANADALDATKQTFITGFERLTINNAYTGGTADTQETLTLDLANLGFTNYVTTSGTLIDGSNLAGESDILVLDKLANNGTVVLTAQGLVTVQIADAAAGKADVLNVEINAGAAANTTADELGILTAANVETINIGVRDTLIQTPTNAAPDTQNLTLVATSATKIVVTGDTALNLTNAGNTKVAEIDGSTLTAALTVTAAGTTATTIKGGSGNDVLSAAAGTADVLLGGDGNDTLTANSGMAILTGGAGNDLFVIGTASTNVNSYATITDFAAGDVLQITGAGSFASAAVVLGDTAVFQDYANAAINALGANDAGWFQFQGNTYVIADIGANETAFNNGQDFIVKLTGLVDLSQASFNATTGTIALV